MTIRFFETAPALSNGKPRLGIDDILPDYPAAGKRGRGMFSFSNYSDEGQLLHHITVAWDKEPKEIAKDIERRLVPTITLRREKALQVIVKDLDYSERQTAALYRVARLLCQPFNDDWTRADRSSPEIGEYGGLRVHVQNPTSFEFKFDVSNLEQVEAAIRAIMPILDPDGPGVPFTAALEAEKKDAASVTA